MYKMYKITSEEIEAADREYARRKQLKAAEKLKDLLAEMSAAMEDIISGDPEKVRAALEKVNYHKEVVWHSLKIGDRSDMSDLQGYDG